MLTVYIHRDLAAGRTLGVTRAPTREPLRPANSYRQNKGTKNRKPSLLQPQQQQQRGLGWCWQLRAQVQRVHVVPKTTRREWATFTMMDTELYLSPELFLFSSLGSDFTLTLCCRCSDPPVHRCLRTPSTRRDGTSNTFSGNVSINC